MKIGNHYVVLDLETTILGLFNRKGSPFHKDNWIVAAGWKRQGGEITGKYYGEDRTAYVGLLAELLADGPKLLVGHNIEFDLQHLFARDPDSYAVYQEWVEAGGLVWDTQIAEFLIRGMTQDVHMISLNETAPRYGGGLKIDEVKAYWDQGINTHLIPKQLLMDYLLGREDMHGDIGNTELTFRGQLQAARDLGMLQSLRLNFGARLASIEMMKNGLRVDKELGLVLAAKLEVDIAQYEEELRGFLPDQLPFTFNWGSPTQRSALIFGGTVKYQGRVNVLDDKGKQAYVSKEVDGYVMIDGAVIQEDYIGEYEDKAFVTYSSGKRKGERKTKRIRVDDLTKPKSRMEELLFTFKGYVKPKDKWKGKEPGTWSTGAKVIEELVEENDTPFLVAYGKLAKATKDLGTYYQVTDEKGVTSGMLTLVGDDGIVHHTINHTSVITGRLSHSNPNAGNLPKASTSEVKRMFISRFPGGHSVSSDFKTLEIYCQAMLTGDKQLIKDLRDKMDMHCARLSTVEGVSYEESLLKAKGGKNPDGSKIPALPEWDVKRSHIKVFSFRRAYGAGAATIAAGLKVDVDLVKEWIEADNKRYPGIERAHEKMLKIVEESAAPTGKWFSHPKTKFKAQLFKTQYQTFDGKIYTFTQSPSPDFLAKKGILASFSPPDLKNYPTQGLGAEFMKAAMWLGVRLFYKYKNFGGLGLLVNTVHDALYGDSHPSVRMKVGAVIHAAMLGASDLIEHLFKTPVPVPVPADTTYGPSMYDEDNFEDSDQLEATARTLREWMRRNYMDGMVPSYHGESYEY